MIATTDSSRSARSLGTVALLVATAGWGSMFIAGKSALHEVDPFWFTVIRYGIAALVFTALLLPRGIEPWRKLRADAVPLALRGVAGFGVFSVLLLAGLVHSVPSHGAVIVATVPMTTQFVRWAFDGVRPAASTMLTGALAMAGIVVVSGVLIGQPGEASTLPGDALIFAGTLGWVWYTRGAARFPKLDVIEYTALTVVASWPLLVAAAAIASVAGISSVPSADGLVLSWRALLFVGLVASSLSVLAYNFGVRSMGTVTATAFLNFVPISALAISVALGKHPSIYEFAGTAMVIAALLIHSAVSRAAGAATPPAPRTAVITSPVACEAIR